MPWCNKHFYAHASPSCPGCIGGYKVCNKHGPHVEPSCQKCQKELNEFVHVMAQNINNKQIRESRMNTPTEAQLNDPKWWDENAPEGATHVAWLNHGWTWWKPGEKKCGMLWHRRFSEWQERYDESIAKHRRPTRPEPQEWDGEGLPPIGCECEVDVSLVDLRKDYLEPFRWCEVLAHRDDCPIVWIPSINLAAKVCNRKAFRPLRTPEQRERDRAVNAEPQPEHEPVADRIMELGNQVHNLGCEVQNDEVLADGCEQIREQLWYLAGQARKARERDQVVNAALLLDEYPSGEGSGGLMSRRAFCEALYDTGMLRKAGGE